MKKRLLSILLALSMVLTFLPLNAVMAFADGSVAHGNCGAEGDGSNLTWTLDSEGTLTISGKGEMVTWNSFNDADWYSLRKNVKQVIIDKDVTSIASFAFNECENLVSIQIPDSVTSIGESAFSGCSSLIGVTVPEKVEIIESCLFSGCSSLADITIPDKVESIGNGAFGNCTNLKSIKIPKNVTSIGMAAFAGCSSLKTVLYAGTEADWKANVEIADVGNDTLKAAEVKFAHTVTFMNGDTEIETKTVPYDEMATAPDKSKVTTPEGKYLTGWYTDKACTEEFDLQKNTIKEDLTLYAGFDYPTLTVTNGTFTCTVDGKEVTESPAKIPVGTEVTVAFDKDAFADSSLKFNYWDIDGLDDPNAYYKKESFTFKMPAKSVTLEAMTQDDSIDDAVAEALGNTAIVGTAILGGAALGVTGYMLGTEMYLICLLPIGTPIPTNTAQLAELVWTDAGKPAPAAVLPEDASEDQQAMAWAVEQDLIDADKAPDASVSRIEVIKTWKKAQSVKVG